MPSGCGAARSDALARDRHRLGGACTGRVQILLGRRERALKRVTAPLRKCRFSAVVTTTSRSSGRWLQVRTVRSATLPALQSRRVRLGR